MNNLAFIKRLPFESVLCDQAHEAALWESDHYVCEHADGSHGLCDPSGHYYGTPDVREPKFCARHFYQIVVSGDGKTNYMLRDLPSE